MLRSKSVLAVLFGCCFRLFTAFLIKAEREFKGASLNSIPEGDSLPPFLDYRYLGKVTPVKDQGNCSACWAFSSIAAIESQWKIHTGKDIILSEQFLIDCNNIGAACGDVSLLKTYAEIAAVLTGVLRKNDYREYDGSNHGRFNCEWDQDLSRLQPVTGFRRVRPGNEEDMKTYLYHNGPLSAGINDASMVNYNPGVNWLDRPTKDSCPDDVTDLNHAILIVGYGVQNNYYGTQVPYWIIKNSWGTDWGDGGYYYLQRGTNACGIANDVIFPFVP